MGDKMQRRDFRLISCLLVIISLQLRKKKKSVDDETGQLNMLPVLEEKPSDEGELLTTYITDYRRIHEYGR